MELKGSHVFPSASPQAVWDALHNSAVLKSAVPGAVQDIQWQGDSAIAFTGGIGPVSGSATAQVVSQTAPSSMQVALSKAGNNATLAVMLTPDGAGTNLTYAANVSGPLSMALLPLKGMMEGQINEFFNRLSI
ncbi:MAG TPA: SRPBCC domain-containing protein [Ktedonobacterales bacterium]|nr:SRPBCC domain-containing protein [Ktedonobacterales bacterium]